MGESVPGTIVSVLQAAAEAAEDAVAENAELGEVVTAAADAAAIALDKTTAQLDVLADAGVVDAGGRGLLVLLDALAKTVSGHAPPAQEYVPSPRPTSAPPSPRPARRFEVMYLLSGCDADGVEHAPSTSRRAGRLGGHRGGDVRRRRPLLGACALRRRGRRHRGGAVVRHAEPDPDHRRSPGARRTHRGGWTRERAVLAVVDGDGAAELFAGEGAACPAARPIATDPTSAVSAKQLLRGARRHGRRPDHGAAQRLRRRRGIGRGCTAAIGWGIDVVPVPAGSMVQGLAALAVHDADRQAVDDGYTMARAAGRRPARLGSACHRGGVDVGGHLRARRRPRHRR